MKKFLFSLFTSTFVATNLMSAPKAIVFDFGGVLTKDTNRAVVVQFIQKSFDLTNEEFEKVNEKKRSAVKQGKTDEEFWLAYAKTRGIQLPGDWSQAFRSVMKDAIGINPDMFSLVAKLQDQQIKVALLSNIDERLSKLIRDFGFYDPFNPCLLSCEIGVEKPDPKAYQILLDKLELPARKILFIDDSPENVESARNIGIDAILFVSTEQLREELSKRDLLKLKNESVE